MLFKRLHAAISIAPPHPPRAILLAYEPHELLDSHFTQSDNGESAIIMAPFLPINPAMLRRNADADVPRRPYAKE
jgi:hypothetical protein